MAMKKWVIGKPDRENAKWLADECGIDPFVALIACSRGISDAAELEQYVSVEPCLCDPRELADITIAADIINAAIENKEKIAVYGDYDCDGVVSTALMYSYLVSKGADAVTYIPDRLSEGYGMNKSAIDKLYREGVKIIVTVDNGISSVEEVEYANSLGMVTVVTDHHIPPEVLPDAAAIVDPKRIDCPSGFKEICGAEVAFKLVCVLEDKEPEEMLPLYSDILSVAVVGDVMPLENENRTIVREGVKKIRRNPVVGITAILNAAGIDRNTVSSNRISFGITPRINAAGRMGSAKRALDLLLCTDMLQALKIAGEIDDDNVKRQTVERSISEIAMKTIEENGYDNDRVIVVCGDNWHMGVTGIAASRICEKYGKPTIVLSRDGDIVHGSGRSYEGFNLFNAVNAVKDRLIRFGGHAQAAGVSLKFDEVDAFRKAINDYAASLPETVPELNIDFKLNPAAMTVDMAHALKLLEPFGNGNPVPVFALCEVKLAKITELSGGKHLKLFFTKEGCSFQALLFNVSKDKFCFKIGDTLDLAVTLEANFFREEYNLSVLIKAIRFSGIDEDKIFFEKQAFEDFITGRKTNREILLPSREQIGEIYKSVRSNEMSAEQIKYDFLKSIGYGKTRISLKVLSELGLISETDGMIKCCENAIKTDLNSSAVYKKLTEGGI